MAAVRIILKTNRKLSEGNYPVMVSLAHLKQPTTYIRIKGLSANKNQWSKSVSRFKPSKGKNYKTLNASLEKIEMRIDAIVEQLLADNNFSYDNFRRIYFEKDSINNNVEDAYKSRAKALTELNKIGTAIFYENSFTAINEFINNKPLTFGDISYKWLKEFEQSRRLKGNSGNTIAIHLRGLRAIHYEFCKTNNLPQPTTYIKFNIQRLTTPTRKRSLSKEQLQSFINYDTPTEAQYHAKQIFLFSFYTRGLNLMDMLQLTDKNIEGDVLFYKRQKTGKQMRIKIVKEAQIILEYFKNNTKYLFPYLRVGDIPKYRVTDVNRNINRRLNLIGKALEIGNITMYYARHTFAELHYKSGIRIEIISQMLGHSDLKTTQIYLRSFSDDEVDDAAYKVINSL